MLGAIAGDIVGAAVGAPHGEGGFPPRWIANLSGRTGSDDDGKVFHLLNQANDIWWRQTMTPKPKK